MILAISYNRRVFRCFIIFAKLKDTAIDRITFGSSDIWSNGFKCAIIAYINILFGIT